MVSEMEQLYERKWRGSVFIVDDHFIGNKRRVQEMLPVLAEWNRRRGRPFTFLTEASVNLAVEFIQESAIPLAMVGLLLALPGTQLYCQLLREGRILDEGHGDNMLARLNFIGPSPKSVIRLRQAAAAGHSSDRWLR
jgi:hypothetical protein